MTREKSMTGKFLELLDLPAELEQFKASKDALARLESKGYPGDSNVAFRKVLGEVGR
jgi:hypothetical protein